MDAASVNRLMTAHRRRRQWTETPTDQLRGVIGVGDGSGRTWSSGGPPGDDHMWVRIGAGFEEDGVTPTAAHPARNISLHEFAEGDVVTLEEMRTGPGPMMLQIAYRERANLFGLFVEAYTHPRGLQIPTTWRILRFTNLPSVEYTDLGFPNGAVGGFGHKSFMAVSQASLYYADPDFWVYRTATGWLGPIGYSLSLYDNPSGGETDRFWVKHGGRVYAIFKTANDKLAVFRANTDATTTLVAEITSAELEGYQIQFVGSLTPETAGRIYLNLNAYADSTAYKSLYWDDAAPAALSTYASAPASIATSQWLYFARRRDGGNVGVITKPGAAAGEIPTYYTGADGTAWASTLTLEKYRNTRQVFPGEAIPMEYLRHLSGSDFDTSHYEPDADGNVWVSLDEMQGDLDNFFLPPATVGDSWVQGGAHYGVTPDAADGVAMSGLGAEMGYLLRFPSTPFGGVIASCYTATPSGLVAPFAIKGGIRIGSKVYFSLGLGASFSDPSVTFPDPFEGGLFTADAASGVVSRFLPLDALGTTGGCGMMMAHNVTESAEV